MSSASLQTSPELDAVEEVTCIHYWIIDVPDGPISQGRCRVCGEAKDFLNYLESYTGWDSGFTLGDGPSGGRELVSQLVGPAGESEEEE